MEPLPLPEAQTTHLKGSNPHPAPAQRVGTGLSPFQLHRSADVSYTSIISACKGGTDDLFPVSLIITVTYDNVNLHELQHLPIALALLLFGSHWVQLASLPSSAWDYLLHEDPRQPPKPALPIVVLRVKKREVCG